MREDAGSTDGGEGLEVLHGVPGEPSLSSAGSCSGADRCRLSLPAAADCGAPRLEDPSRPLLCLEWPRPPVARNSSWELGDVRGVDSSLERLNTRAVLPGPHWMLSWRNARRELLGGPAPGAPRESPAGLVGALGSNWGESGCAGAPGAYRGSGLLGLREGWEEPWVLRDCTAWPRIESMLRGARLCRAPTALVTAAGGAGCQACRGAGLGPALEESPAGRRGIPEKDRALGTASRGPCGGWCWYCCWLCCCGCGWSCCWG